jgi:hypothetical protein
MPQASCPIRLRTRVEGHVPSEHLPGAIQRRGCEGPVLRSKPVTNGPLAERIGEAVRLASQDARVLPIAEVRDLKDYDAAIIGSAV